MSMRKLSKIWTAMLCAILMFVSAAPASAEAQMETKTKSLDVMLVVDDTVSMQRNDPNHIASLALEKFVERIPGEGSRVGMATYDDDILTSTSSLTGTDQPMMRVMELDDKERLREYARSGLTQDGRFTDLPGALYYAATQIKKLPPMDSIPAIIAVSDGENDFINTAAKNRSDNMLEEVLKADIPVYLIVIHASDRTDVRDYMQGIADTTKGQAFFVDSGDQVDESLVEIVNELYGLKSDDTITIDIGPEPVDWGFSLPTGVFEATVELTHEMELEMELYGPGTAEIPLQGSQDVAMTSMQDRDGLKTIIRLMEPNAGEYFLRLASPQGQQPLVGEIILNNEIYVQVTLSPNPAKEGENVEVTATLMRGVNPYTDLEFANLNARISVDGQSEDDMERDENEGVFRYSLPVPDSQKDEIQLTVTVQGQRSFLRKSDPVTLAVESSEGGSLKKQPVVIPSIVMPNGKPAIWMIVLAAALLLIIILIVIVLVIRYLNSGKNPPTFRLQGTLTVRFYDDMHQFIWERYVRPGAGYTKRNPRESLGRMLSDQQQDYGDVPQYFDKIFITGLQYGNGRMCVEVTGELDGPSGPEKINRRIDIANGRGMSGMDDMDDMDFFEEMSYTSITFPDGRQTEIEFSL